MTILLAAVNARFTHASPVLRYLRNAIEAVFKEMGGQAGSGTAKPGAIILREYHIGQNRLEIARDMALAAPDVLLLSVYIWNAELISAILPDLRAMLPGCRLILGGPEAAYNAGAWLAAHPELDLVVSGEGETAVTVLARAGFSTEAYPDRLMIAPPVDFSAVPMPYRAEDFKALEHRYLYYESSRGCPFACSYCLSSRSDHGLRFKPATLVKAELDGIVATRPMLVKFVDRTFNADKARAREIWSHLIREHSGSGSRFHFEVHPALLGFDDFALLEQAPDGLFQFELGVQTIHERTRAAIHRTGDWSREKEAIQRLIALGTVHIHLDMIVGLPYEGMAEVGASFEELSGLGAGHFQIGFLKGLPGTELRKRAGEYGMAFQSAPPYTVLYSSALSARELAALARLEELYDNIGNTGKYRPEMEKAAAFHGGSFAAYLALSGFCINTGFDIRTRNEVKIRELLGAWLQ
ncbi:MAG: hypothetical protein A3J97_13140 [Spirochaetes bacterium RIFOXYC1_FULL_54_7]|nr:MAG: hypothetical protein A3J97_13140 [Spirochaetes bacterium RIFOXYC1_FULL_54_7]